MNEEDYQMGIRNLSTHDLITLVGIYRKKLKGCQNLCADFAQKNFAQDVMHKVFCAHMEADLDIIINDYEAALRRERS